MTMICVCNAISDKTIKKVLKEKAAHKERVSEPLLYLESLEGREPSKRCFRCVCEFQNFAREHNQKIDGSSEQAPPLPQPEIGIETA